MATARRGCKTRHGAQTDRTAGRRDVTACGRDASAGRLGLNSCCSAPRPLLAGFHMPRIFEHSTTGWLDARHPPHPSSRLAPSVSTGVTWSLRAFVPRRGSAMFNASAVSLHAANICIFYLCAACLLLSLHAGFICGTRMAAHAGVPAAISVTACLCARAGRFPALCNSTP